MKRLDPNTPREHFELLLATVGDGIVVVDCTGQVLYANAAAVQLFSGRALMGRNLGLPLVTPGNFSDVQLVGGGGLLRWAELRSAAITWDGREAFLLSLHDVTERKESERQLELAAEVFAVASEGIVIADVNGTILMVNRAFCEVTGYSTEEAIGRNPRFLKSGHQNAAFYRAMWDSVAKSGHWQGEIWNRRKDGTVYPEWLNITRVDGRPGSAPNLVGVFTDLSSREDFESRIRRLSRIDALTGLPNRAVFQDRLGQAISRAAVGAEHCAVMLLNLDRFRLVNEAYGVAVGDRLLYEVGQRLREVVSSPDTLARLGSDEFGVIDVACGNRDEALGAARRVSEALGPPFSIEGHVFSLGARIGVAFFPEDGLNPSALLSAADAALVSARDEGRSGPSFARADLNRSALRRLTLEAEMRGAVGRGELRLHFQPQVDGFSGRVIGAEALLRWQRSPEELVSPAEFIPIAEECGLIVEIGEWVLCEACRTAATWCGAQQQALRVAVNVSVRQLAAGGFPALVERALASTGLAREALEIEVTESALASSSPIAVESIERLTDAGIRLSLDDFGTGYSSLSYVGQFAFNIIKIDQSFVRDIVTNPKSAAIARATLAMARGLDMQVVAEGVETAAQFNYLRKLSCNLMQGYLFSRPVPAADFATLLRAPPSPAELFVESQGGRTLLCVDDEPNVLAALRRALRSEGYRVLTAYGPLEALEVMAANEVQVLITDQRMPVMSGTELLRKVRELYPQVVRMMLSGYTEVDTITSAINEGAIFRFVHKPWDDSALREQIREAFLAHEARPRELS